jgi:hypothetical protein
VTKTLCRTNEQSLGGHASSIACNGFRQELLRLNPAIRAGVEQVERENATIQHLVVERPDVKLWTQFLPSAFAKFDELELPDFVTKGLGRPGNVAVCFGLDLGLVEGAGFAEEVDHLLAAPALGVDARIDDQAHRAKALALESAPIRDRILVEANLFAELLGIERPTFDVARIRPQKAVLAEFRQICHLLRYGQLHVVAGNAFVIGGRLVIDQAAMREVVGGDDDPAGPPL